MAYIYHPKVQSTSKLLTATLVFIYFIAAVILLLNPEEAREEQPVKSHFSKSPYNLQAINTVELFRINKQVVKN